MVGYDTGAAILTVANGGPSVQRPLLRVLRHCEEMHQLEGPWRAIEDRLLMPTQSFAWAVSGATAFALEHLRVPVVDGGGFAAAPLVLRGSTYELVANGELYEPGDFTYANLDALQCLAEQLAHRAAPLRLRRIPQSSPTLDTLARAYHRRAVITTRPGVGLPWIDLLSAKGDADALLSRSLRTDLRRARRKAQEMGEVRVEILHRGMISIRRALVDALRVEASGWKGRHGSALLHDPLRRRFFVRLSATAWEHGALRIAFLRVGERIAAMQIAMVTSSAWWLLKIGYDPSYSACSPGSLLMESTLRHAVEQGLTAYELLGCPALWTQRWTQTLRECRDVQVHPMTPRSVVSLVQHAALVTGARVKREVRRAELAPRALRTLTASRLQWGLERVVPVFRAGASLEAAVLMTKVLHQRGYRVALGYFAAPEEDPAVSAACYRDAVEHLGTLGTQGSYVSVKLSALQYDAGRLRSLVEHGTKQGVRIHVDSLDHAGAKPSWMLVRSLCADAHEVGVTLPGRWVRSVHDAERAAELGLAVRVVKGQWEDPSAPMMDGRRGFMNVVRAAQGCPVVQVATHDVELAEQALGELYDRGQTCVLELLLGMPSRALLHLCRSRNVPVRIYVPYGANWLPYSLGELVRHPARTRWLLGELIRELPDTLVASRRPYPAAPAPWPDATT